MLERLSRLPQSFRRLAAFVAASCALHAATLAGVPPSGVAAAPQRGTAQPEPLRATLSPRDSGGPSTSESASSAARSEAPADSREGVAGGADLPFPDKWYSAAELDVRAEPIGEVQLDYPEELEGSGIPGKVRLLLFIDERGVVRRMRVTEAEPARIFDKAALRAWSGVEFSPARKGGIAVKSQKLLELDFRP